MFASLVLASRGRPLATWLGAVVGFTIHVVIAVSVGVAIFELLSHRVVDVIVAVLFAAGAAYAFHSRNDEDEVAEVTSRPTALRTAATATGVIFVAEWGGVRDRRAPRARLPTMSTADRTPVIVGVGHATRHPIDLATTTETADLLAAAIVEAGEDAGIGEKGLADIDSLDVLNLLSWKYADPAGAVAARVGAHPARSLFSDIGGEQPTALVDAAAGRIQRGETTLAVIVGGECLASRRLWGKTGQEPPWSDRGEPPIPLPGL